MGLYDGIKDVAKVMQQADNIELYRKLLELSAQALELQDEVSRLREENAELKKRSNIANRIIRHEEPCITLKDDNVALYYCSHCWDSVQLLIQLNCHADGTFHCLHCKASGIYDTQKKKEHDAAQLRALANISSGVRTRKY